MRKERRPKSDTHELTSNSPDEKSVRWGWVTAKPSEFLIVYRGGKLAPALCGQGARVFKWPSDSVAVLPTTLKEVVFQANQNTVDQVDVRLRGMLVYQITDPLRLHKLINFSSRQRAEAKLGRMISDMCRSTVKWLVANMTLDECNRRRKEEIARSLKQEVAAVATESWGVDIVTIDIQDVFVQDEELFQAMQARFKAEKEREASLARLKLERDLEQQQIADQREAARERHALEVERVRLENEAKLSELQHKRGSDERQFELDNYRVDQEAQIQLRKAKQLAERERVVAQADLHRAEIRRDAERLLEQQRLDDLRQRFEIESSAGRGSLERLFVQEALPQLAQVLASALEGSNLNVYQGAMPLDGVLRGLTGLLQGTSPAGEDAS